MGRFVAKIGENEYVLWSTVVDAAVTFACTADELVEHIAEDAAERAREEARAAIERADENGHSDRVHRGVPVEERLVPNRQGEGEKSMGWDDLVAYLRAGSERG